MKKLFIITFLILLTVFPLAAQYSPGVEWKQIKSDNFQIIFPAELEQDARRAVLIAEEYYQHNTYESTKHPYRRWPLVLTNRTTVANGYVDPLNQKTVWESTPLGEPLGAQEWYKTLAVHEGRHIAQFERYKRGLLYLGYLFSGNGSIAFGGSLINPMWYAEGDAIDRETMFTDGGRGRNTLFHREMEAIIMEEDGFSYQKVKNGSYKDNIPNHYHLGYPLVAYTRSQYGEDSWDKFMSGATWLPLPIIGPTVGSVYATGHSPHTLYNEMTERWAAERRSQIKTEVYTDVDIISNDNDYVTYDSLSSLPDGSVLARRHSMNYPAELVKFSEGVEEVVGRVPGWSPIVFGGKYMVNLESVAHPRYATVNSTEIILTDNSSGKHRQLTKGGRYTSIAMNKAETEIAAVELALDRRAYLVLINTASGLETRRIALPEGVRGFAPEFNSEGNMLVILLRNSEGLALAEFNLNDNSAEFIIRLPYSNETFRRPSYCDEGILFSSNYNGREAIYLLTEDNERRLIAQRPYTAVEPVDSASDDGFYYIDYNGMKGDRIVKASYPNPGTTSLPENRLGRTIVPSFGLENGKNPEALYIEPSPEAMTALEVKDYHPAANLFRVTGFSPLLNDEAAENSEATTTAPESVGLSLTSHDVLDTLNLKLKTSYYLKEKTFGGGISADIKSFYPLISINGSYVYRKPESGDFHEATYGLDISLPLNLSRGLWYTAMEASTGFSGRYKKIVEDNSEAHSFPIYYRLGFNHLLSGSAKSLSPVLGFSVNTAAAHTPFNAANEYLLTASVTGYLPGIFRNNTIMLNAGIEQQNGDYASILPGAKGYNIISGTDLLHIEAEYLFPIFYPDFAIGPFAYLKRLKGDIFGQFTRRDGENHSSAGLQLDIDFTAADLPIPLSAGFRASYLFEEGKMNYEFTLMGD